MIYKKSLSVGMSAIIAIVMVAPEFLKGHPRLADFLTNDREFAQRVKQYPGSFLQRVRWYHRSQGVKDSKAP